MKPEANQQIRRQSHDFPAHEEKQQAVGNDNAEHRARKQREEAEEACEVIVVGHIAQAVNENQQANKRDHHQHHGGQRIEQPPQRHPLIAELHPAKIHDLNCRMAERRRKGQERKQQRDRHRSNRQRRRHPPLRPRQQRAHARSQHRQHGNQPEMPHDPTHPFISVISLTSEVRA